MYLKEGACAPAFRQVPEAGASDWQQRVQVIGERIGCALGKRGVIERDCESAWLSALGKFSG